MTASWRWIIDPPTTYYCPCRLTFSFVQSSVDIYKGLYYSKALMCRGLLPLLVLNVCLFQCSCVGACSFSPQPSRCYNYQYCSCFFTFCKCYFSASIIVCYGDDLLLSLVAVRSISLQHVYLSHAAGEKWSRGRIDRADRIQHQFYD